MHLLQSARSIFLRIGLVVTAVLMILLISLFIYLFYEINSTKNITKEITAELSSSNVLDKIDRNFYERFGDVQAFAYNHLARQTIDSGRAVSGLQPFINTMTTYYVLYDLMMVVDKNGNVLVTNTVDKNGKVLETSFMLQKNFREEEWFKTCMGSPGPDGGAWYSKFTANPDVGHIYNSYGFGMGFAAPIRNSAGKVEGVWFNYASWKEITQSIRTEAEHDLNIKEPGSLIILTRPNGEVIDAADVNLIRRKLVIDEKTTDNSEKNTISVGDSSIALADYTAKWATAKGAYTYKGRNWRAVTLIPRSKISLAAMLSRELITIYSIILLIVAVCGYFIFRYVNKRVVKKIHAIKDDLDKIASGEVVKIDPLLKSADEIGDMSESMEKLAVNIERTSHFAEAIGKGDLDSSYKPRSDKDALGIALLNMQKNLQIVKEQEQQRNWATEGLARFGEIVRKYSDDTAHMADILVSELVKYMGANQCMLYTVEIRKENEEKYLKLTACFAYDRKKFIEKEIEFGEGLAGQAYLEKEMHFITDVPDNYMKITSGLGEANPSSLIIVPLLYESEVMGVLEIASFEVLPEFKRNFLDKVGVVIASALRNLQINNRTNKLLLDSQAMMEQLRTQEEEMRQNMEELTATQEESERKQVRSEKELSFYHILMDTLPFPLFVKDEENKFVVVNKAQENVLGIQRKEILYMQVESLLNESDKNLHKQIEIPFVNPITEESNVVVIGTEPADEKANVA